MASSGGTLLNNSGGVRSVAVLESHVVLATDVYIHGTLHRADGFMYVTTDVPVAEPTDVMIEGIRHVAANGVRRVISGTSATVHAVRGGMSVVETGGLPGRQRIATSLTTLQGYVAGIAVGDDNDFALEGGRMLHQA